MRAAVMRTIDQRPDEFSEQVVMGRIHARPDIAFRWDPRQPPTPSREVMP
jgi:hypothetical protein